ncbi:MAG: hypothetical protein KAW45_00805 [Thermoplasmatales archaeon]|nr:hypothetical protein [Thermoplasmatales archaeon]
MKIHCNQCGEEVDSLLPFKCRYCGLHYCKHHHLPENHNCVNLPSRRPLIKQPDKPLIKSEESDVTEPLPEVEDEKEPEIKNESEADLNIKIIDQEKPKKSKKVKRYRSRKYNIRISNLAKIFLASLILFIILHLILPSAPLREVWMLYIIVLCVTEVTGLLLLLFNLDRISIHTTLRLWGLRILAGIILFIGLWFLVMLWISSMFYMIFYPFIDVDPLIDFLSILPFLIPGFGLMGIGGYLEFKFRRESGLIVHRG